jgi:ubiquitin carboxyl-terminal hydrolase 34
MDERRVPELISPAYLHPLHSLTRREDFRHHHGQPYDAELAWQRSDEIAELVDQFQRIQGGSIQSMTQFIQAQVALIPRFPKLLDSLTHPCQLVLDILRESNRQIHASPSPLLLDQATKRLGHGFTFYNHAAMALLNGIEKHVTNLTNDGALAQIVALTEIYNISLHSDHKLAAETLREHRQHNPKLPPKHTAEVVAWEWRFNMFGKLIMSSQMQLRVMAVTNMCNDLVMFWKRFQDVGEDRNNPFLSYFAEYLLRTKLVEYILGPTCHPEITAESGNIVGFLMVTRFYQKEQTDLLWQTITTSQDPRVVDGVIKMSTQIANLQDIDGSLYLCQKLLTLPISGFTLAVRHLCDKVFGNLVQKCQFEQITLSFLPYKLCLRLLRESSVCGPQSQVAHPEVQSWAMLKFKDLLTQGPDAEGRRELYLSCIQDIADKSATTLGSIWALSSAVRNQLSNELRVLTTEHDLTRLLVDELEHAITAGRAAGVPAVISGTTNSPRREFIYSIVVYEASTITPTLGVRLWDMLVGRGAGCQEDRKYGWQILNNAVKRHTFDNPVLATCFTEYLPNLPPECFCDGALEFIREGILPRVNNINDIVLDDEESMAKSGIEQLWRIILTAADQTIASSAIQTLVNGVYIESKSILTYPHHRARQVHLAVVNRCLRQLGVAAKGLRAFSDGTMSGDDEPMVIVATEAQVKDQERIFSRSLAVLRQFLREHQATSHFASPDLRSLMPRSANSVEGDSAGLKYQSFDESTQTPVLPLNIGRQNTAASLLASLRDATGFENYRIYYRGQRLVPNHEDICRSLEDLRIHDGLILVKREEPGAALSTRIKPGASLLEIEVLSHFNDLWGYLSMEDKLAQEVSLPELLPITISLVTDLSQIYQFLISLPADDHVLEAVESEATSYEQLFPVGYPWKSLYAIYALKEHVAAVRRTENAAQSSVTETSSIRTLEALRNGFSLVVAAISDSEVIDRCSSERMQTLLSFYLLDYVVSVVKGNYTILHSPLTMTRLTYQQNLGNTRNEGSLLQSMCPSLTASCPFSRVLCSNGVPIAASFSR